MDILLCINIYLPSAGASPTTPVLAGMIYAYTDKAEKELKNRQEKVMLMQTLWS